MIPEARPLSTEDEQYGHQILQTLTDHYKLDYNNPKAQTVQDIVDRLTKAAGADKDPWHVYILQDPKVKNAAATRGNHVFVWTGMLNAASSDAELATVISHEISHILAGHTDPDPNEEAKALLINLGALAAGIAVSAVTRSPTWSNDLGNLTSSATQELGKGFLLYPYSREREAEADRIGMFMMADAKFDPRAAIAFWTKIPTDPDYREGPSFLSTHPPAEERLQALRVLLPQALERYEGRVPKPPFWSLHSHLRTGPSPSPSAGRGTGTGASLPAPGGTPAQSPSPSGAPSPSPIRAPAPPLPPGDSFGLNSRTPEAPELWTVSARRAVLYRAASLKSRRLGEFRHGAQISGRKASGAWVEVFSPDHGFVPMSELTERR